MKKACDNVIISNTWPIIGIVGFKTGGSRASSCTLERRHKRRSAPPINAVAIAVALRASVSTMAILNLVAGVSRQSYSSGLYKNKFWAKKKDEVCFQFNVMSQRHHLSHVQR